MSDIVPRNAGVVAPPPLLVGGALIAGLLLDRALPLRLSRLKEARGTLGLGLLISAVALGGWAAVTLKRAGTNVVPHKPSTALTVDGPFAQSRNPIYTAMLAAYLGVAAWIGSLGALILLAPLAVALNRGVVAREEIYLERLFGDAYRAYRAAVPRWL